MEGSDFLGNMEGSESSRNQKRTQQSIVYERIDHSAVIFRNVLIPFQLVFGFTILAIFIILLPLLYLAFLVRYKFYVLKRDRVIRGIQRNDEIDIKPAEARFSKIRLGALKDRTSLFTSSRISLVNGRSSVTKLADLNDDFDLDVEAGRFDDINVELTELKSYAGSYKITCQCAKVTEEEDIVKTIKLAGKRGLKVRAMGSLFSWPNIVQPGDTSSSGLTDGVILDLKDYNKMVKVLALPEDETQSDGTVAFVTVQSGMKVWALCDLLDHLGYALPVLGNVTGQSVGGALSTGTHGKNSRFGTLSSLIQNMRLVLASGKVENIALRDEFGQYSKDPISLAAGVSLGLIGVISTVTLRVVPKHRLAFSIDVIPFQEFISGSYQDILDNSEHVGFMYFPFIDKIRVERSRKLTPAEEKLNNKKMPTQSRTKLFFAQALNYLIFESQFGKWFEPIVWIVGLAAALDGVSQASLKKPAIDKSYKIVANNVHLDIEHHEMEYAFDAKVAKEVIEAYRNVFKSLPAKFQYSTILDIRFSANDSAWLAGSSEQHTVWLDLIRPNIHKDTVSVMNAFKETILKYKGRPHFGKENILQTEELSKSFPNFKRFIDMRERLDPDKLFANPYFESVFDEAREQKSFTKLNRRSSIVNTLALTTAMDLEDNEYLDPEEIEALTQNTRRYTSLSGKYYQTYPVA